MTVIAQLLPLLSLATLAITSPLQADISPAYGPSTSALTTDLAIVPDFSSWALLDFGGANCGGGIVGSFSGTGGSNCFNVVPPTSCKYPLPIFPFFFVWNVATQRLTLPQSSSQAQGLSSSFTWQITVREILCRHSRWAARRVRLCLPTGFDFRRLRLFREDGRNLEWIYY